MNSCLAFVTTIVNELNIANTPLTEASVLSDEFHTRLQEESEQLDPQHASDIIASASGWHDSFEPHGDSPTEMLQSLAYSCMVYEAGEMLGLPY